MMDILVPTTMKNAAKRDMYCELHNSVNHQNFERILRQSACILVCHLQSLNQSIFLYSASLLVKLFKNFIVRFIYV